MLQNTERELDLFSLKRGFQEGINSTLAILRGVHQKGRGRLLTVMHARRTRNTGHE